MRDLSVGWLLSSWERLNGDASIVKKAWQITGLHAAFDRQVQRAAGKMRDAGKLWRVPQGYDAEIGDEDEQQLFSKGFDSEPDEDDLVPLAQLAARATAKAAKASSSTAAAAASIQDVVVQATAAEEYLQIDEQLALQSEVLQAGMEAYAIRVAAVAAEAAADSLLPLDENASVDNVEGGEVAVEDLGHFDSAQDGEGDDDAMQVDDGGYFGEREVGDVGGMDSVQSEEGEAHAQMVCEVLRDAVTSYEGSAEAWSTLIAFLSSPVLKLDDNVRTAALANIQAGLVVVDFSQGTLICQQFFTRYVKASFWLVQNIQEFMTIGNNHLGLYEGGALCASEALSVAFDLEPLPDVFDWSNMYVQFKD
ncbi:unnamed protein product [Sphagnum jensenii]|uniref:Uncharacterized protein n=1 Tax=Sphagnum jensenii TaxID=128206 RepID=A0ABP0VSB5_9BRYO